MKTKITTEEYKNIYEVCGWDPKTFSIVLKRLGYSDDLIVLGNLDFRNTPIKSLVNVKNVESNLDLQGTPIQDLGNLEEVGGYLDLVVTPIQDLGKLRKVGGNLYLVETPIQDLGNLEEVGVGLWLKNTPLSKKYSEKEIRQMVKVKGGIYL